MARETSGLVGSVYEKLLLPQVLSPTLHSQVRSPFPQKSGLLYFFQDKMHWKLSGFTDPAGDRVAC